MKETWVISIRDQCREAGVRFFFKQWGGVQKARNGRVLHGRTWNELPETVSA
jgi:protein gp37